MAKVEEAYSLEFADVIDVEKAYELYWEGKITDKRAFECPTCSLKITAANIDKVRADMKNTPHFRSYGEHEPNCIYKIEVLDEKIREIKNYNNDQLYIDNQLDSLLLDRPRTNLSVTNNSSAKKIKTQVEVGEVQRTKKEKYQTKKKSKYYSIKPLISKFLRYKKENKTKDKYIEINKEKISYEDMFKNLASIDLKNISDSKKIYYGEGNIVRSKKKIGDYIVFFKPGIRNKDNKKTALYISEKVIKENRIHKKWIFELDKLCDEKRSIYFFVYCTIHHNTSTNYINLSGYSKMDFVDFRI